MTRVDVAVALVAGTLAALVAAATVPGLAAGLVGVALLAAALATSRRGLAWIAGIPLVAAPGIAALSGAGRAVVLVGIPAALLGWDAGHRALRLGRFERVRVGPSVVHGGGTAAVGVLVAVGVHFGTGALASVAPLSVLLALVGAFVLAAALGE